MKFDDCSVRCKSLGGILALPESVEDVQQMNNELGNVSNFLISSSLCHFSLLSHRRLLLSLGSV